MVGTAQLAVTQSYKLTPDVFSSMTDEPEMLFAFIYRVEDEDKLSSVREHMADKGGRVKESYTAFHENMEGENLHIVTWEAK